jgi:hypothetical protein
MVILINLTPNVLCGVHQEWTLETNNIHDRDLQNVNFSKPLKKGLPWDQVKGPLKVDKLIKDFRRAMSLLFNDGLEGEDMINVLVLGLETCLPSSLKLCPLKLP